MELKTTEEFEFTEHHVRLFKAGVNYTTTYPEVTRLLGSEIATSYPITMYYFMTVRHAISLIRQEYPQVPNLGTYKRFNEGTWYWVGEPSQDATSRPQEPSGEAKPAPVEKYATLGN